MDSCSGKNLPDDFRTILEYKSRLKCLKTGNVFLVLDESAQREIVKTSTTIRLNWEHFLLVMFIK